jgi:hypothetical protein
MAQVVQMANFLTKPSKMSKQIFKLIFLLSLLILSQSTHSQTVAINEVMASNAITIADEDGDFEDWVELHNYGTSAINLLGYGLSDNSASPFKWVFPSITMEPGSYLLVWASGKNRVNPSLVLHTNFSISAAGEDILLTEPLGSLVDGVAPIAIPTGYSYGKYPNGSGSWRFFTSPTPNAQNIGPGYSFLLSPPQFSHPDGAYTSTFNLTIAPPIEGAQVYFTLDGSEPTTSSTPYTNPISISSRVGVPNDISMIPTNNSSTGPPYFEGWQPPLGEVYKINVVRARAFHPETPPSEVSTSSYLVDPLGGNRYSLPLLSITTHRDNLFDDEIGIYVLGNHTNYFQDGMEWERPANIIFFEPNTTLAFKEDVGIRLHGNTTRSRPRKSIRVSTRSEYGNSWINYPIFPNKPVDTYKRFLLRNSGNDWDWTIFRDAFMQYLVKDLNVGTQFFRPSVLFINGEYWGIHNIRDRYDENYIISHYGIAENEMTMMENNALFKFGNEAGVNHYNNMVNYIDVNNIGIDAHYETVKTMMSVESFIDFQLTHIFVMNTDWPGNNSLYWRYLRDGYDPSAPAGKDGLWRWFILDTDFGFGLNFEYVPGVNEGPAHNTLAFATASNGPGWPNPPWSTLMLRKLLTNQKFKESFINRYCDLLNTTFSSEHVLSVIDSISNILEPEMQEHINRWRRPSSLDSWHQNVDVLRTFADLRPSYQLQHIKQKFSLAGEALVTLNVSNQLSGFIRVNTIDIKPTTMGISDYPYPWTGTYFRGIPIQIEAIPLPGYQFSHWEGASISTNPILSINPTGNIQLTAVFTKTSEPQLVHFWFFGTGIANDTPLESIGSTYSLTGEGQINFHSALEGYPFNSGHPNWRKASMERRNSPTDINYRPEGNSNIAFEVANMRGIQAKQPFTGDGGENTLVLQSPTTGYGEIVLRFVAKDEGAADGLTVDCSVSAGEPQWLAESATSLSLSTVFQLFEVDFSDIEGSQNNANFKVRIRFTGSNMTADLGNRVTFNNISIDGVALEAYTITSSAGANGTIEPLGNISVFEGGHQSFTIRPNDGYGILDVAVDGQSVLNDLTILSSGIGEFNFGNVTSNHTIHTTFLVATSDSHNGLNGAVSLFPNPSNGTFSIKGPMEIIGVEVYNMTGQKVYQRSLSTKEQMLSIPNIPKGFYTIRILLLDGVVLKKLIIE